MRPSPAPHTTRARRSAAAGAIVTLLVLGLSACGVGTVALSDLVVEMEDYHGHTVTTHGMVREFGEDDGAIVRHVVVQDTEDNRVRLLPTEVAEGYVGTMVEVTGEFELDSERGRLIHIDEIAPAQ